MLIYLDNCCFNRPFDLQDQMRIKMETEAKLAIQAEVRTGNLRLAWSYILDFENDANPCPDRKESILRWKKYATFDTAASDFIVRMAYDFCSKGFSKKDSLHLACAISMKCDRFFTTDDGILKKRNKIKEIRILNPIEYYANYND